MDVINEIEVLETDIKDCNEKCQRVNCSAIYDAIMSSLKLLYDLVFFVLQKERLIEINNIIWYNFKVFFSFLSSLYL